MEVDPQDTTPVSQARHRRVIKEPTKFTPDKGEVRLGASEKTKTNILCFASTSIDCCKTIKITGITINKSKWRRTFRLFIVTFNDKYKFKGTRNSVETRRELSCLYSEFHAAVDTVSYQIILRVNFVENTADCNKVLNGPQNITSLFTLCFFSQKSASWIRRPNEKTRQHRKKTTITKWVCNDLGWIRRCSIFRCSLRFMVSFQCSHYGYTLIIEKKIK